MNIAIIGSGIAGLLPAYYLSRLGNSVTVYEQESYPAMRTSYANGGQISVSNSEVWTSWSNIFKGVKWILKKDLKRLEIQQLQLATKITKAFIINLKQSRLVLCKNSTR